MKDEKIRKEFGNNISALKGKNIQAIYKTNPAKPIVPTPYDTKARALLNAAMNEVVVNKKDVNTVLRETDESLNKYIQEIKEK